jgi:hypothetical protein
LQEGGLRIRARDDRARGDALAGVEFHTGRPVRLDQDACDGRRRAHLGAGCGGGPGERGAERTHASHRLRQSRGSARRLPRQAVEKRQHGAGRTRAEIRAEHGVEGERAAQRGQREMLLEQIVHVHPADAQQFAHVAPPELANLPAQARQRRRVPPIPGPEPRRHLREQRHQRLGEALHLRRIGGICGRVRADAALAQFQRRPVRGQRRGRHRSSRPLEAMAAQIEIAHQIRAKLMHEMRASGYVEARRELARDGGAAHLPLRLEHEHGPAAAGQGGRTHESIVACADDDAVVARGRGSRVRGRCGRSRGGRGCHGHVSAASPNP